MNISNMDQKFGKIMEFLPWAAPVVWFRSVTLVSGAALCSKCWSHRNGEPNLDRLFGRLWRDVSIEDMPGPSWVAPQREKNVCQSVYVCLFVWMPTTLHTKNDAHPILTFNLFQQCSSANSKFQSHLRHSIVAIGIRGQSDRNTAHAKE